MRDAEDGKKESIKEPAERKVPKENRSKTS